MSGTIENILLKLWHWYSNPDWKPCVNKTTADACFEAGSYKCYNKAIMQSLSRANSCSEKLTQATSMDCKIVDEFLNVEQGPMDKTMHLLNHSIVCRGKIKGY